MHPIVVSLVAAGAFFGISAIAGVAIGKFITFIDDRIDSD